jgi:hypothetical protein
VPRLCEFYPGICLTTEEKARKTLSQGRKNLSQVKNLSQSTAYIYQTHTLQNPHIYTHTLQNNIKPPQYKLKQNAIGKATQWGERTYYSISLKRTSHPLAAYPYQEELNVEKVESRFLTQPMCRWQVICSSKVTCEGQHPRLSECTVLVIFV